MEDIDLVNQYSLEIGIIIVGILAITLAYEAWRDK